MSEFKVSKQAIEDISRGVASPEASPSPDEDFDVPNQVVSELGKLAGDASGASALLDPEPAPLVKKRMLDPEAVERERASRNFSFTDGETQHVYDQLSAKNKHLVRRLRGKLLTHFNSITKEGGEKSFEGVFSNRSIALLQVPNGLYMIHMGEPIEDMPVMGEFIRAGHKQYSDRAMSKSIQLRYLGVSFKVVDLAKTPAYDPQALSIGMGGSPDEWRAALPPLDEALPVEPGKRKWSPWAPAVKLR